MVASKKTHYEILELTADAKPIDVKKAYRRLALKHHPDRNGGSAESTEQFKLISEAYTILSDPTSRRCYDNELKSPTSAVSPSKSSSSRRTSTYSNDPFQQFNDLFTNDPFFHGAFEGMDDAFAARFNDTHAKQEEECEGYAFWGCGNDNPKDKKTLSWGAWIMSKLGIEFTVTSYSKKADGSMAKSYYASNDATNKQSRTYIDKQGRKVTVMSMEKDGNTMEDMFVAGELVERKVNGVVEVRHPTFTKDASCDSTATTESPTKDRIL
eukprot:CAMPEP_0201729762 /NCGR_PEP_ID=MMETSP0593-20130828/20024_1 /ASSEMBLY_ACC=CAM_ASM_000672 /TAXON_ID=267983 /ORGANISM="Skeletonema japonicum, Strain CCMP2506" /LENGTH=267 /DNA_ID=CAMNT_0048222169 /DNA_START=36 /DNA_END=839 /DNA_ORIENTATION=-